MRRIIAEHSANQGDHVERIAFGPLMDRTCQLIQRRRIGRFALDSIFKILGHLIRREWRQRQLLATSSRQFGHKDSKRMLRRKNRERPMRTDYQQSRVLRPPRQQVDQGDRRRIAPMQILERQHHRSPDA